MNETWQRDNGLQEDSKRDMAKTIKMMNEAIEAFDWVQKHGGLEQVNMDWKRLMPKEILDVSGTPVKRGDTVYGMSDGKKWYVIGFNYDIKHCVTAIDGDGVVRDLKPEWITHEKPAFGADGLPFWAGQRVYDVETGDGYIVSYISDDGQYFYPTDFYEPDLIKCSSVTSAKPEQDSWERIKIDAFLAPLYYVEKYGNSSTQTNAEFQRTDLVRRCKALAEKENN